MSRSAVVLLIMTLASLSALWLSPELDANLALLLKCASGVFGLAFLVALMAGRRIKFDPVLR
ncbi:PA3371 family protein [Pseudomonas sp. AA-38]|uniref:PA3371 family protein n=1 Tax=Pseudomonas sp. AA-38 TaxID=3028807 RepID=UPI0023FA1E6C|nr:PA3371 family protein [Pseudomonas sp. AA-38]